MATLILGDQEAPCDSCGGNRLLCGCDPFVQFSDILPEPSSWKRVKAWLADRCPWCDSRMVHLKTWWSPIQRLVAYCPKGHRAVYARSHRHVVEEAHGGVLLALWRMVPRTQRNAPKA